MSDRLAATILTVLIVGYVATLASSVQKTVETLKFSNDEACCMKIPYVYRGRTNEVCYNPTDTTYNFVEREIIRQWKETKETKE